MTGRRPKPTAIRRAIAGHRPQRGGGPEPIDKIEFVIVSTDENGRFIERPIADARPAHACAQPGPDHPRRHPSLIDGRL